MSQRHTREGFGNVSFFGARGFEELLANGGIVEQLSNFDCCTDRRANGFDRLVLTTVDGQLVTAVVIGGARPNVVWLISAIDARASPRKPNVPTLNKSSASTILLVA